MTERWCPLGLTHDELEAEIGGQLGAFWEWMRGQTMALCDEHGPVVYEDDVRRFIRGLPVVD